MSIYNSIGSKKMTKYTWELTFTELKHNYHNIKHIKKPFESVKCLYISEQIGCMSIMYRHSYQSYSAFP